MPESAKLAAELGGAPDEEPVIEEKREIDGKEKSVVSYATWLDTQLYGDDLKFINADFVEFELESAQNLDRPEPRRGQGRPLLGRRLCAGGGVGRESARRSSEERGL